MTMSMEKTSCRNELQSSFFKDDSQTVYALWIFTCRCDFQYSTLFSATHNTCNILSQNFQFSRL